MKARKSFQNLMALSCLAAAMVALAIASPVLVGWLLEQSQGNPSAQNSLLACLFLPTLADWPSHTLSYMVSAIALLGLLLGVGTIVGQWYRTRRMLGLLSSLPAPVNDMCDRRWQRMLATLELQGRVDLIGTDKPIAFCHGWMRPRICISTGMYSRLNEQELTALLIHERHHIKCHDPLKTAVSRALANTFFFLPAVKALQHQYTVAKEIDADEHVLHSQGSNRPLLSALYKLFLHQTQGEIGASGSLVVVGSTDVVNQRLDYLLNGRAPSGMRLPILFTSSAIIAAIGTVMVLTIWTSAASALWHQAHAVLGGC